MRVLILGATGFIGRHVAAHLHNRGHAVVGVSRRRAAAFERHPQYGWIPGDLHCDLEPEAWARRLHRFDAVVNCAGLHREARDASFETVHALGPVALYNACVSAGVRRIVHLTVPGNAAACRSHWLATRRYAERRLESLPLDWVVLEHALILGEEPPLLAELPVGLARMAPLSIADLCEAVEHALEDPAAARRHYRLTGRKTFAALKETGDFAELTGRPPRSTAPGPLTLLYDGACPICVYEMKRLASLDRRKRLAYRDIAAPGFDAGRYGTSFEAMMGRMHALTADGRMLVGLEAIRAAYRAVGLGWVLAPTRLPWLSRVADRAYAWFAEHRYAISRWLGMRCEGSCNLGSR
jgi:uncharacterized protein YbjT (DUF2867 family)